MKRRCTRCKFYKVVSAFYSRRSCYCKKCQRAVSQEAYEINKDLYKNSRKTRHAARAIWIAELKIARGGCVDCGYNAHLVALDFDHRPGTIKRFNISRAHKLSEKAIIDEMAKCDIVCANCHRVRTKRRREVEQFL